MTEKKSKSGRRKFIGHVIRDDPNIDKESKLPIEKRGLLSTDADVDITLETIPRTEKSGVNIVGKQKRPDKIHKPLHRTIPWETLKREIELDKEARKREKGQ